MPFEPGRCRPEVLPQFQEQARLAKAGLTDQKDHLSMPCLGLRKAINKEL